jgi:hypothetical protein
MERDKRDIREGVEDADATGMVAGEELITTAETMLPLLRPEALPREDLHAALPPAHPAHAAIDQLHEEIHSSRPDRAAIERHVGVLRALPELEARIANWWDDPNTQRYVATIDQIGL